MIFFNGRITIKVFFLVYLFIFGCAGLSLVSVNRGYSLVAVHRLLIATVSLVALEHWLSICGSWTLLSLGTWDLPRPGTEPMFPALTGKFFTAESSEKPPL